MTKTSSKWVVVLCTVALTGTAFAAPVDRREHRQQARIAQGVQSGQLTQGEAERLERREAQIHEQVHQDRAAHGGHLTPAERRQINREQNRTSRAIYRNKHNAAVQP